MILSLEFLFVIYAIIAHQVSAQDCSYDPSDLDGSGVVDFNDLLQVLASWGDCDEGSCGNIEEECQPHIDWAMNTGIYTNPEWYPELTPDSPMVDFQCLLAAYDSQPDCVNFPCNYECPGSEMQCDSDDEVCAGHVYWAMNTGIYSNPEWYPNLTPDSPAEAFQCELALMESSECSMEPCDFACDGIYEDGAGGDGVGDTPNAVTVSCGNPANNNCLDDYCAPASELHEVRCCSDEQIDNYQQRNECEVWAESQFLSVGEGGDGCVHDADLGTAIAVCAVDGARLCTLSEIQGACTAGTGCGHDADSIWTDDVCNNVDLFLTDGTLRNYADSVAWCQSQGMQIASIHSQEENDLVFSMLTTTSYLGANEDENGVWSWDDGSEWDYLNPENDGLNSDTESNLAFADYDGLWHDWNNGESELGVVCRAVQCGEIEEACQGHIDWAMNTGINTNPEWYPGLNPDSPIEDFQCLLAGYDSQPDCVNYPCNWVCPGTEMQCDTDDEVCAGHVEWAMNTGIFTNPEWYPNLTPNSPYEAFQCELALMESSECSMEPCDFACDGEYSDSAQGDGGGLYFEGYSVEPGTMQALMDMYDTIEQDPWNGMTPTVEHPALSQNIWYSNDQDFIDEIPDFDSADNYYMRWRGEISIAESGTYMFRTTSDDGSLVIIDGELVVNNDGWHGMQSVEGSIQLSAGFHTITIPFYEDGGGSGLEVSYAAEGDAYIQLNYDVLFPPNTNIEWCWYCGSDAAPETSVISCGNPNNADCLDDFCETSDALHEVRCCSDEQIDNYQQRNDCEVWAESQFLSVGEPGGGPDGPGCVHEASLQTAINTCYGDGARLCTLAEIQGSCTAGTGCGHDADMIWTSEECDADYNNPSYTSGYQYVGCFADNTDGVRDLPYQADATQDPQVCATQCADAGYSYMGQQWTDECFCGDEYGSQGVGYECGTNGELCANGEANCGNVNAVYFASGSSCATVTTYDEANNYWILEEMPLGISKAVTFSVMAGNDAHVGFFSETMESSELYEIVIGGWGNSQSVIRACGQCDNEVVLADYAPLDGGEYRQFWADAVDGLVRVGEGSTVGQNTLLEWQDPDHHIAEYVGVMTGWGSGGDWEVCTASAGYSGGNQFVAAIGGSGENTKTITVGYTDIECPSVVSIENWLGTDTYGDVFLVTTDGSTITADRDDSDGGWGMDLQFYCYGTPTDDLAAAGLYFEAWALDGGANMVALLSEESYPTIEIDAWMPDIIGEPTVSHDALEQALNYGNDQAFIDEIPDFDSGDKYYMRWRGEVNVPVDGEYGIRTTSDDGSLIIIDGQLIVDNDGWHGMQTVEGSVYLSAGPHTITIPFYEDGGGAGLVVEYNPLGQGWTDLTPDVLSPMNNQIVWCFYCGGLHFEAYELDGDAEMVMLTSDQSYPTIQSNVWMNMEPTVSHGSLAQEFNYGNDQAFIDEIPDFDSGDKYYMRWRGEITISEDGTYDFSTNSDDGSLVIIDGQLIVDNDGWHGMQTVEGSVELSAGAHTITIPFYEDGGGSGLIVQWRPSGGEWALLSNTILSPPNTELAWCYYCNVADAVIVSCGNPANNNCLDDFCADASELHEVRC
jgi:hypothetical protein